MSKNLIGYRVFRAVWAFAGTSALFTMLVARSVGAQIAFPPSPTSPSMQPFQEKTGVILKEKGVSDGYVLIATRGHTATYLINSNGATVHQWHHDKIADMAAYLLPNGNLLHAVKNSPKETGNVIQELSWNGDIVWEYSTDQAFQRMHHDIERLPNGNTLVTVWERVPFEEYVAAGRDPDTVPNNEMWVCAIHEIKKTGRDSGEVVWRWSAWDHLVQDFDESKANFGDASKHPNRVDVNQLRMHEGQFKKLADWIHINAVSYDPDWGDEIILSSHALSEIWVVSRKTGELVYRWGNPRRYGQGNEDDQVLFNQHDPHRIAKGLRGAGNILIFNNNNKVREGMPQYSSVMEVKPPLTSSGDWPLPVNGKYPPCEIVWKYPDSYDPKIFSPIVSNAQRLGSGGTLVCVGVKGTVIELDETGKCVWKYVNPVRRQVGKIKKLEKWNTFPSPGKNMLFRAYKYPPDYPAFQGKGLNREGLLRAPEPSGDAAPLPSP